MKQLLIIAVFLALSTGTAVAQEKNWTKEMTLTGEVVDVACYLGVGAKGPGHIKCATACAKAGGALGILTADGKLYVSLLPDRHRENPNAMLMDYIGKDVEAKGTVHVKSGVNGIMIKSVTAATM